MRFSLAILFAGIGLVLLSCASAPPPPPPPPPAPKVEPVEVKKTRPPRDRGIEHIRDRRSGGVVRVKAMKVSGGVEVGTNQAIKPVNAFHRGVRKVCASFEVTGLEAGGTIRVLWFEYDNQTEEFDIESEGNKRYSVCIEDGKGIGDGEYRVEVEIAREVYAERSFSVGGDSVSPYIERSLLGTKAGKNKLPKKAADKFKPHTKAVHCGVRIIGLPDVAIVKVDWVHLGEDGEKVLDSSEAEVKGGGRANVLLTFRPKGSLETGQYKAVIFLGSQKMEELPFTVQ